MSSNLIPAIITLIAGAIMSIINLVQKVDTQTGLSKLLTVLIVSYIIGLIAKNIVVKIVSKTPEDENQEESTNEELQEAKETEDKNQ